MGLLAAPATRVSYSGGIANIAVGKAATDGNTAAPTAIICGFAPRYLKWVILTGASAGVMAEWFDGMAQAVADAVAVNTAVAGDRTVLAAAAGITIGVGPTAGQFTVPAALIPASSTFAWLAIG